MTTALTDMDTLFDLTQHYSRRIRNDASARNAIGEVAQEFTCAVLGLSPLRIDGRVEACADAEGYNRKWEIKSVGRNGRGIIYKWRIEKELRVFGRDFVYCFMRHACPITIRSGAEIVKQFMDNPPTFIVATVGEVFDAISVRPHRKFKLFEKEYPTIYRRTTAGYNRKGYCDGGWQFALSQIPTQCVSEVTGNFAGVKVSTQMQFSNLCPF